MKEKVNEETQEGSPLRGALHFRATQDTKIPIFSQLFRSSNLKIAELVLAHQTLMILAESAAMPTGVLNIYLCKLLTYRLLLCQRKGSLQLFQYYIEQQSISSENAF